MQLLCKENYYISIKEVYSVIYIRICEDVSKLHVFIESVNLWRFQEMHTIFNIVLHYAVYI